ncbi:MAG: hypothetical protein ACE5G9_09630 [Nitrospinales bacterium]
MSLIEKNHLNYLSTVEQFFLSLKDSGLCLSATDYHLIGEWEERGIPATRLCRAIELGYQRNRDAVRRISLVYLKDFIEEEIERATP